MLARTPDLLCVFRILLGPALILSLDGQPFVPLLIVCLAMATDFVDGKLARALGVATQRGLYLDVAADGFFLLCGLGWAAARGWTSPFLPLAVLGALTGLVLQWRRQRPDGKTPRGWADRAGHLAGTVNYFALLLAMSVPLLWVSASTSRCLSLLVVLLNLSPVFLRRWIPVVPRP